MLDNPFKNSSVEKKLNTDAFANKTQTALDYNFFATCPRGLEHLLVDELQQLEANEINISSGGVAFSGAEQLIYRVNLYSRIATRVLWRIFSGAYRNEHDLYHLAYHLNWAQWFDVKQTFFVKMTASKCPLKSIEFATLKVKDAICDYFRKTVNSRPGIDKRYPDVRVYVYLQKHLCQIYLDTSGQSLYQRGLRQLAVEAPINENLAAGILKISNWQTSQTLMDPMCGSGTFLSEASLMARNIPAGNYRQFGFEKLKMFAPEMWQKIKQIAQDHIVKGQSEINIYGRDISSQAIKIATKNLQQNGLIEFVKLSCQDFSQSTPPTKAGILIANLPYGVRIEQQPLDFYEKIATTLKKQFAGWTVYFLSNDLQLPQKLRLKPFQKVVLFNGGIECRLFGFRMVEGSNRKK